MPRRIPLEPLTAEAFAAFGTVIEADQARSHLINEGRCRRYHALATADPGEGGAAILSIFRATAWPRPIRIAMLERHPLGTQAFVPMQRHPWLAVVAEQPEPHACRAFLARGDQGLQIEAGVWHHPLLALAPVHDFLVVDRAGPGDNLEERHF
ncbi:MAG TPA: ureidoglycolate lyase, partial [Thermohalobaculum sp.]|nr:ureidoglycolate lyase [Thermohalobaculum sp.]